MKTKLIAIVLISLSCAQAAPAFAEKAAANYAKLCVSCHGKDKKGNPAMAKMFKAEPAAMDLTAIPAEADIAAIISGGRNKMPAYKAKLTAEEVAALASYFKPAEVIAADAAATETKAPEAVVTDTKTADTAATETKAAEVKPAAKPADSADYKAKCVSCHAKDGKGNPAMAKMFKVGPELMDLTGKTIQEKADEDLAKAIADGKNKMPSFKDKLGADQIKELVAFLRTLAK